MPNKPTESKLWLYVMVTMALIAAVWAIVFYPQSLKQSNAQVSGNFSDLKNKINQAFSILKKSPAPAVLNEPSDMDVLRAQVFGDSAERAE